MAATHSRSQTHTHIFNTIMHTQKCLHADQEMPWLINGVLKVVLHGSPYEKLAAVSTVMGLFSVDFNEPTPIIAACETSAPGGGTMSVQYNDICWARGSVYAALSDMSGVGVDHFVHA